jgi:tetratricopeptide (TPR) repeat protein
MAKQRKKKPSKSPVPPPAAPKRDWRYVAGVAALVVVTLIVYASVVSDPFITLDDHEYVSHNDHVLGGLSASGIGWAFSTFHAANWHPLTWISHMIDVSLFDTKAGAHHFMNVLFHALAAAALFAALFALTGAPGRSLAVAALFALHPLAVESAAWISERKNVLCALFWFLALWKYAHYARTKRSRDFALVMLFFALSLLSKPMAVTFPAALLLIDYWPLQRRPLIGEKIPLFVMSAIASFVTIQAQSAGGAVRSLEKISLGARVSNATVSYINYLGKAFWPRRLAAFYPFGHASAAIVTACALALIAITAGAFLLRKRWPFLLTGWLWFLGTLVPMIGIVQVGEQSMADRYTYVPLIGIFIALVWLVAALTQPLAQHRVLQPALAIVIVAVLAVCTHEQLRYWRSSKELFTHTIEVAGSSAMAHNSLGGAYVEDGDVVHGEQEFRKALEINPTLIDARANLANALAREDRADDAIDAYQKVLEIDPGLADIHNNLGVALARKGRMSEAVPHFYRALAIDPDFAPAREILDQLARQGVPVERYR